jgi:F-type H+-transporting ATPase subunit epsilon
MTTLVSPEAVLLETEATFAVIPADDGQMGILKNRAPVATRLTPGILKIETPGGVYRYFVGGGYAQLKANHLSVMAEEALPEEAVNADRVAAEESQLSQTDAGNAQAVKIAQLRINAMRKLMAGD